jgi:hypothetical protein
LNTAEFTRALAKVQVVNTRVMERFGASCPLERISIFPGETFDAYIGVQKPKQAEILAKSELAPQIEEFIRTQLDELGFGIAASIRLNMIYLSAREIHNRQR